MLQIDMEYDNNRIEKITLYGGGYGHGAGMSQNGAKEMAKAVAPVRGMANKGPMHKIMALIISMAGIPPSLCNSPSLLSMQFDASMA